jgi:lipid-binding SYLF domain-containing protein
MSFHRLLWTVPFAVAAVTASCANDSRTPAEIGAADRARAVEELHDATIVLGDMVGSDKVSPEQRRRVRCVVVVPSLVSGGLILGARHGDGVATCRTADGWSPPAFVSITGGSAGLQAGVQSADVVMMVRSARGMSQLFRSSFELAGDTSAAAGPVGASAQAATDASMTAEIISYAHSRGLFAGVEISGAAMKEDRGLASGLYGASPDVQAILQGSIPAPAEARGFLDAVSQAFPR